MFISNSIFPVSKIFEDNFPFGNKDIKKMYKYDIGYDDLLNYTKSKLPIRTQSDEDTFYAEIFLVGCNKSNVKLTVEDRYIYIDVEYPKIEEKNRAFKKSMYTDAKFYIQIPSGFDVDKTTSEYITDTHSILISVPRETSSKKTIMIK